MVLKTMKLLEHSVTTIKHESFLENENPEFLGQLKDYEEGDWSLDIVLEELFKIDDIFSDGVLIKKQITKPLSSAKPEKVSLIEFDLWIYACTSSCYTPEYPTECVYRSTAQLPHDPAGGSGSLKFYIDDPSLSKMLKNALLRTKKQELALFYCGAVSEFVRKDSFDGKLLKPLPERVYYYLRVHDFSEGKNNFTMDVDEKIAQAIRKKQHGLDYIKVHNFGKALKVFKTINAYFDYGSFTEQDKDKMREVIRPLSLLSSTKSPPS